MGQELARQDALEQGRGRLSQQARSHHLGADGKRWRLSATTSLTHNHPQPPTPPEPTEPKTRNSFRAPVSLSDCKTNSWIPTADIRGGAQADSCHASDLQDGRMIGPRFPLRLPMMVTGFPYLTPEKHRIHVCFRDPMNLLAAAGRSIHDRIEAELVPRKPIMLQATAADLASVRIPRPVQPGLCRERRPVHRSTVTA